MDNQGYPPNNTAKRLKTLTGFVQLPDTDPALDDVLKRGALTSQGIYAGYWGPATAASTIATGLATTGSPVITSGALQPLSAGQYLQTTGTGSTAAWAPLGTGQTIFGQLISTTNTTTMGVTTAFQKFPGLSIRIANGITVSAANSDITVVQQAFYDQTFDLSITGAGNNTFLLQGFVNGAAQGNSVEFSTSTPSTTSWSSSFETLSPVQLSPGDTLDVRIALVSGTQTITLQRVSHITKALITGIQGPAGPAGPGGTVVPYSTFNFPPTASFTVNDANMYFFMFKTDNASALVSSVNFWFATNSGGGTNFQYCFYTRDLNNAPSTGGAHYIKVAAMPITSANSASQTGFIRFTFTPITLPALSGQNVYYLGLKAISMGANNWIHYARDYATQATCCAGGLVLSSAAAGLSATPMFPTGALTSNLYAQIQ